jgi:hypothetical protein
MFVPYTFIFFNILWPVESCDIYWAQADLTSIVCLVNTPSVLSILLKHTIGGRPSCLGGVFIA